MPYRDETLPHQIVILNEVETYGHRQRVSCNCLRESVKPGGKGASNTTYRYMEEVPKDAKDSIRIYNNPANHNPHAEAFRIVPSARSTKWA